MSHEVLEEFSTPTEGSDDNVEALALKRELEEVKPEVSLVKVGRRKSTVHLFANSLREKVKPPSEIVNLIKDLGFVDKIIHSKDSTDRRFRDYFKFM